MTPVFVSDLFRDYLAHADSITAGVPADSVLLKQSLSDPKVGAPPRLVVEVETDSKLPHPKKRLFNVHLLITAESRTTTGDTAHGTSRDTAETWLDAIRRRLANQTAFAAWIAANRTIEEPPAWQISKLAMFAVSEEFGVDATDLTFTLKLPCKLTAVLIT